MNRLYFFAGALLAGIAVAMGAYGAHATSLEEVQALWIDKASRYQMYHGLALVATGLSLTNRRTFTLLPNLAGLCFLAGIALFSGSLYVMAFSNFDAGYLTPAGGFLFLGGWVLLALSGPGGGGRSRR